MRSTSSSTSGVYNPNASCSYSGPERTPLSGSDAYDAVESSSFDEIYSSSSKEKSKMSYCIALRNSSYIVLASDSRSTMPVGEQGYVVEDDFPKIAYFDDLQLAIAAAGRNRIDGVPIMDYLRGIKDEFVGKSCADVLTLIQKKIAPKLEGKQTINVLVANKLDAVFLDITRDASQAPQPFLTTWNAGYNKDFFDAHYLEKEKVILDCNTFTLNTMIRFAEHIVRTQMELDYFLGRASVIGGPIQVCVLNKDGIVREKSRLL